MTCLCLSLLLVFSFTESQADNTGQLKVVGPDAPVFAVTGEDLILPCFIQSSTSAVHMRVEWFRLDTKNSLVHLYKDNTDKNENQAQSYRGRTSLFKEELEKGNASLKLSAVRVSDEGEYKCFVGDKSRYDDIIVKVTVEVAGSHPVIMVESYDNSGGINLVCESRGWNPEPEVLWLDRDRDTLPAEETQAHRDTEGFNVKRRVTVYENNDLNRFHCRLQQKHQMRETEVIINSRLFEFWRIAVPAISILALLTTAGFVLMITFIYQKKEMQRERVADEMQRKRVADEMWRERVAVEMWRERVADEMWRERVADENEREKLENDFEMEKQYAEMQRKRVADEFEKKKKYKVSVSLDPETAYPKLILSDDGKQVAHGDTKQDLPDTPQRFNFNRYVLAKQSFSSGRFYYEVQVKGKTDWDLGVATESINRKGIFTLTPQKGFWCVSLWNKNQYRACAGPAVPLTLRGEVEKVGVFVDYEEGLVSFYDVKSSSHIYSFTGQSFTEKLYPFFSPCHNKKGRNRFPLIID